LEVRGVKDMATSTHGIEALSVNGAVVAEPNPVRYSLHPWEASLASQPPAPLATVVYPAPTVYFVELEPVSTFPTANEFAFGVKEPTLAEVEPPDELPLEESKPAVEYPASSYIETEPATTAEKVAVIVSAAELEAVAYQIEDT
jgi:hypothetical protein